MNLPFLEVRQWLGWETLNKGSFFCCFELEDQSRQTMMLQGWGKPLSSLPDHYRAWGYCTSRNAWVRSKTQKPGNWSLTPNLYFAGRTIITGELQTGMWQTSQRMQQGNQAYNTNVNWDFQILWKEKQKGEIIYSSVFCAPENKAQWDHKDASSNSHPALYS